MGGEQYILSAVMHADEINRAMTEALGREVYHYPVSYTHLDESLRSAWGHLPFEGVFLFQFLRWIFSDKVLTGTSMGNAFLQMCIRDREVTMAAAQRALNINLVIVFIFLSFDYYCS